MIKQNYSEFTEALLENLKEVKKENVEVEIRFGRIINKFTHERMDLDVLHPILIRNLGHGYSFMNGVSKKDFNAVQNNFKDTECVKSKDTVIFDNRNRYRYVDGVLVDCIRKEKKKVFHIYNPVINYDIRIGICNETVVKIENQPNNAIKRISERVRMRNSYKFDDFVLDCTEVSSSGNLLYEVEMEVLHPLIDYQRFIIEAFKMFPEINF